MGHQKVQAAVTMTAMMAMVAQEAAVVVMVMGAAVI
jgi:hypothetical protein